MILPGKEGRQEGTALQNVNLKVKVKVAQSSLFVTPWIYSAWNSPGQNTGVGSLSLLQGIFPTQGSNLGGG